MATAEPKRGLTESEAVKLADGVAEGDRRALARAITLVESARPEDRSAARTVLKRLQPRMGGALRLALTGAPGVGKSTFIENFGLMLAEAGEKLVVLAIDPSSRISGGAILGDKTRMERLARHPNAFIRPSPAQDTLGGVARRTRETMILAEAFGASVVILETVGVGQSEVAAKDLSDVFTLLIGPAAGDELQGVKRGVMEMADLVVVTKADGGLADQARHTAADYANALRLMRRRPSDPEGTPSAMSVSSATGAGLPELWEKIRAIHAWRGETGWRDKLRAQQASAWLKTEISRGLEEAFARDPAVALRRCEIEAAVARGEITPDAAADQLLALFLND